MGRIRGTAIFMDKQVLHILSVCLYLYLPKTESVCAVLYCHLCSVRIYHIFLHYIIRVTIFGKKICGTQNVCFELDVRVTMHH